MATRNIIMCKQNLSTRLFKPETLEQNLTEKLGKLRDLDRKINRVLFVLGFQEPVLLIYVHYLRQMRGNTPCQKMRQDFVRPQQRTTNKGGARL